MKKCVKCLIPKEAKDFSLNKGKPDGLSSECKECHKEYRKSYYDRNKQKEIDNSSKNKKDIKNRNPTTICTFCSTPIFKFPRDLKSSVNHFCDNYCFSKYRDKGILNWTLNNVKKRAQVKDLECDLTLDFLENLFYNLQKGKCSLTNFEIKLSKSEDGISSFEKASLDRIDSLKGYTRDNVQFVVLAINYMKMRSTQEEVKDFIEKLKKC